jgi:hypothetical protein
MDVDDKKKKLKASVVMGEVKEQSEMVKAGLQLQLRDPQ